MADARKGLFFAVGLAAGGALAVWAYMTFIGAPEVATPPVFVPAAQPLAPEPQATVAAAPDRALSPAPAAGSCPGEPALVRGNAQDGQFSLQAALGTAPGSEPGSFLKVAEEVNAAGRVRDAEVAFIVACRLAERASGFQSAPLADAKTELAEHYALLAARENSTTQRRELLRRAEMLLADSVQAYTAALGRNASKTRLANRQLDALARIPLYPQETVVESSPAGASQGVQPVTPPNPFAQVQPAEDRSARQESAPQPAVRAEPRPRLLERSEPPPQQAAAPADDAQTLGAAPATVLRSSELEQLDRDLDRLYSQARSVSEDPAGVQRRHQAALAQRNACGGSEACLRNWYTQRRRQLFSEF